MPQFKPMSGITISNKQVNTCFGYVACPMGQVSIAVLINNVHCGYEDFTGVKSLINLLNGAWIGP